MLASRSTMSKIDNSNIESHLIEKRVFRPRKEFSQKARIKSLDQYRRMYRESIKQPEKFWPREAGELTWRTRWKKVVEWKAPFSYLSGLTHESTSGEKQSKRARKARTNGVFAGSLQVSFSAPTGIRARSSLLYFDRCRYLDLVVVQGFFAAGAAKLQNTTSRRTQPSDPHSVRQR